MTIATNLGNLSAKHTLQCCGKDITKKQRGRDPEWIKANACSMSAKDASDELKILAKEDGIMFSGANGVMQYRPDIQWRLENGKWSGKYMSESWVEGGGYDAYLPKHPTNPNYWRDIENLKKHCYIIDGIPCLIITEGVIKAIAACEHGHSAISLLGVEMGLTPSKHDPQGRRYLVDTLEKYAKIAAKHGMGFILAFDADSYTNPKVAWALLKLGEQLKKFDVPVFCLPQWDVSEGKGIDDYIQMNEIEKFRQELLARSLPFDEWAEKYAPKKGNKPPAADILGREIAEKYKDKWIYSNEHKGWLEYELEQRKGVWDFVDDKYIDAQINIILNARGITGYSSHGYIDNIRKKIQLELFTRKWKSDRNLLPFLDCVLELDTGKRRDHSPANRLLWILPRNYNVVTKSWQTIDKWLDEATQGNQHHKQILLCFAAAILRQRGDLQKFLHLIGIGGSGKGVFTNLMTNLIGKDNCAFLSIEDLSEKDAIADMFGKALIVFSDQDPVGKRLGNFKRLTGFDQLRGRHLFKNAFSFRHLGMTLVTSNKHIFHSGTGRWLIRRALPVPFNHHPKVIRNLEKEFECELSAFTNYLLSIPESQIESVLREEKQNTEVSSTLWETQIRSDGLASWVNDRLIHSPTSKTQIGSNSKEWQTEEYDPYNSTLFGSYCNHCRQTNRSPLTKENFSGDLLELLNHVLGWGVEKRKSNGRMHIVGVRLRTDEDRDIPYLEETLAQGESQGQNQGENGENPKTSQKEDKGEQGELLASIEPTLIVKDNNDENNLSSPKDSHDPFDRSDRHDLEKDLKNPLEAAQNPPPTSPPSPTKSGVGFEASPEPSPTPSPEASPNSEPHRTYPVTKDSPLEIFEEYPHYWTEDPRAKRNEAIAIKNQILECSSKEELDQFRANSKYSDKQINWVWHNILTGAEKGRIEAMISTKQLELDYSQESPEWKVGATVLNSDRTQQGKIEKLDGDYVEVNWEDNTYSSTFRESLFLVPQ